MPLRRDFGRRNFMPRYFFNVVLDGLQTADATGRDLPDDNAARQHAHDLIARGYR